MKKWRLAMAKTRHNKSKLEREADKKVKPQVEVLGKKAVAWLKATAIEHAGEYRGDRFHNCGDVVRGLGLGNGWDSREKAYPSVMRGLKRAEELGFVEVQRHGSPIGFRYVGPEVEAAKAAKEKAKEQRRRRLQTIANKLRLKGVSVERDRYGDDETKVVLTPAAFERLAEKAGVTAK